MKKLSLFILIALLFSACKDESEADAFERNKAEIEQHLVDNNLVAEQTESGLYYIINDEGDSDRPGPSTEVVTNYVGTLLNGVEFDSNNDISFPLDGVIAGWTEGLQLIGRGGNIELFIPARLAYGNVPPSGSVISVNEALYFEVDLLDF